MKEYSEYLSRFISALGLPITLIILSLYSAEGGREFLFLHGLFNILALLSLSQITHKNLIYMKKGFFVLNLYDLAFPVLCFSIIIFLMDIEHLLYYIILCITLLLDLILKAQQKFINSFMNYFYAYLIICVFILYGAKEETLFLILLVSRLVLTIICIFLWKNSLVFKGFAIKSCKINFSPIYSLLLPISVNLYPVIFNSSENIILIRIILAFANLISMIQVLKFLRKVNSLEYKIARKTTMVLFLFIIMLLSPYKLLEEWSYVFFIFYLSFFNRKLNLIGARGKLTMINFLIIILIICLFSFLVYYLETSYAVIPIIFTFILLLMQQNKYSKNEIF